MRKIVTILQRDLVSTTRDAIMLYIVIAPILLSFGLRLLMPEVGSASINLVVIQQDAPVLQAQLEPYANVEVVADDAALQQRVLAFDDAAGVMLDGQGSYLVVLEGNESHDTQVLPAMVLQHAVAGGAAGTQVVEVGEVKTPYREIVGAFVALSVLFISSIVMGFQIIEDKESRVMLALGVSPLNRRTYVLARAVFVVVMAVITVFCSLWALGLSGFNPLQLLAFTLVGSLSAILFGYMVGALSANQISGIANIKFGFLLLLLPAILTLVIPQKYWTALYWLPTYWTFTGYKAILVEGVGWDRLGVVLAATLVTSLVFLGVAYPWLRSRLDFARD